MNLEGKRILLGVTGSIAAYRAADICSQCVKLGADVHVVMTEAATKIITPMTLQVMSRNPVGCDMWDARGWQPDHIELAASAALLLVAPAPAKTIAQFALGLAPDLLSSIYLATLAPVMIAPAMNGKMLAHPATQQNIRTLMDRGVRFIEPVDGMLACGYEGKGKLAPVDAVVRAVVAFFETAGA